MKKIQSDLFMQFLVISNEIDKRFRFWYNQIPAWKASDAGVSYFEETNLLLNSLISINESITNIKKFNKDRYI